MSTTALRGQTIPKHIVLAKTGTPLYTESLAKFLVDIDRYKAEGCDAEIALYNAYIDHVSEAFCHGADGVRRIHERAFEEVTA